MRSIRVLFVAALLSGLVHASPSSASTPVVADGMELVMTIPEVGAVGGKVREIRGRSYFVMTSLRGVSAYDVSTPEVPVLVSHLPLPHIQNEDVDFNDDILLIAVDPAFATTPAGGLYVIDLSGLPGPMTFAHLNPLTGNRFRGTWTDPDDGRFHHYTGGHTVSCIRADCSWAYATGPGGSSSRLYAIDLRDPSEPVLARSWVSEVGDTHDLQVDATGLAWMVGSRGFAALDTTDPVNPVTVTRHDPGSLGYHHNSLRPRADEWVPRSSGDDDPALRPGEKLLITEENWLQPMCDGQGRFATASLIDFDRSDADGNPPATVEIRDRWDTELNGFPPGTLTDGDNVATVTCSAHYFDERNDLVAIAWYHQGLRLLDVSDPDDIRQVGYFIGPGTEAFDARWVSDDIVYSIDAQRGIDVLRVTAGTTASTVRAPILPQWLAPAAARTPGLQPHPVWGYGCAVVSR